ncbi:MAG: hypothetical protein LIO93_04995, partial [Bacteroidales bacterium]|nr:hypothetical protein [Bacteroidales bacterium]
VLSHLEKNINYPFHPEDFYIVSVQHLLESTGSMFESFIKIGFIPSHIYLTGKIYSTHKETQDKLKELGINVIESSFPKKLGYYSESLVSDIYRMWEELSKELKPNSKIIILDDGGYTLVNIPQSILENHSIYGIEQTTSGINMIKAKKNFPIIHLAESAAKVIIEPPMISEAVKIQLGEIIDEIKPERIGIIGYGHIGEAITKKFRKNYAISVYDNNKKLKRDDVPEGVTFCESSDELYHSSDIIVGATGKDISQMSWLENSTGDKILISVSSGDVEFNTLLRKSKPYLTEEITDPLQVISLKTRQNHSLKILRGGMVANFTGSRHSSPGDSIQMTRGLLFSAVMQILRDHRHLFTNDNPIMLDPYLQKEVVGIWFEDQPQRKTDYSEEILLGFEDIDWIKDHSN